MQDDFSVRKELIIILHWVSNGSAIMRVHTSLYRKQSMYYESGLKDILNVRRS